MSTTHDHDRYVQAVIGLIERNGGGTSFVEIERTLTESGMNVEGDFALDIGRNVIVWAGVSEEFIAVVESVRDSGMAHMRPTQPLVYLIDGKHLNLPMAYRPPAKGYKDPHWAPVCWQVGPYRESVPATEGRLGRSVSAP